MPFFFLLFYSFTPDPLKEGKDTLLHSFSRKMPKKKAWSLKKTKGVATFFFGKGGVGREKAKSRPMAFKSQPSVLLQFRLAKKKGEDKLRKKRSRQTGSQMMMLSNVAEKKSIFTELILYLELFLEHLKTTFDFNCSLCKW